MLYRQKKNSHIRSTGKTRKMNNMQLTSIGLEISNPCNEHCVHCYRHSLNSKKGFLSSKDVESVLNQAKKLGAKNVTVTGGESLLNPEWRKICKATESFGFRVSLFTNGSLMTESDADFIASLKNLKEVQFSLYSLDEEVHDKITRLKGSCAKTKNAIRMLRERKVPVFISCPAMQENKNSFPDVMRKMDAENIPSCVDLMIFGSSDYKGENLSHQLTEKDLEDFFPIAMENGGELSYIFGKSRLKNIDETYFYGGATSSLCVSGDGTIYPMISWYEPLGNIRTDSLKDVFENNPLLKEIRTIKASDIPECEECDASDFCTFCPTPHLNANHGELCKLDKNFCNYVCLVKKFAQRKDKILQEKKGDF